MAVGVWPTATVLTLPLAVSMKPSWPLASPPAARSVLPSFTTAMARGWNDRANVFMILLSAKEMHAIWLAVSSAM